MRIMERWRSMPYPLLIEGKLAVTNKKARCRNCGAIIPRDVKRLRLYESFFSRMRGHHMTWRCYCLNCALKIMPKYIQMYGKETKKWKQILSSVSHKDKIYSTKRIKEQKLLEDI